MPTLTVKSDIPNARPVTVTEASPERGKFPRADEATAASKVNNAMAVPERAATVTEERGIGASATPAMQRRTVLVVQLDVLHNAYASDALAVISVIAKFMPISVKDDVALNGEFVRSHD
jgi:hypothetical protein